MAAGEEGEFPSDQEIGEEFRMFAKVWQHSLALTDFMKKRDLNPDEGMHLVALFVAWHACQGDEVKDEASQRYAAGVLNNAFVAIRLYLNALPKQEPRSDA